MQILRLIFLLFKRGSFRDIYGVFRYGRVSYSQFGEDLVVFHALGQKPGFYVDAGAFHPVYLSNTYLLHKNGWRGVNIDASLKTIQLFQRLRPGDINLHAALSDEEREIDFCTFGDISGVNYIVEAGSQANNTITTAPPQARTRMRTQTLRQLLDAHLPTGTSIDLLTVDCEGQDLNVLRSNDWSKYRPKMILVEDWRDEDQSEVVAFCRAKGYRLIATCHLTRIFQLAP
jgi:FkbM family methyltransferase